MTAPAKLDDAFSHAISEGRLTTEQWDGVRWLAANLTPDQKRGFTERWRAIPSAAVITTPVDKAIQLKVPYFDGSFRPGHGWWLDLSLV